jgi:hypothetical protein
MNICRYDPPNFLSIEELAYKSFVLSCGAFTLDGAVTLINSSTITGLTTIIHWIDNTCKHI